MVAKLAQKRGVLYEELKNGIARFTYRGRQRSAHMDCLRELGRVAVFTMFEEWKALVDKELTPEDAKPAGDEFSRCMTAIKVRLEMAYEQYSEGDQIGTLELLNQCARICNDAYMIVGHECVLAHGIAADATNPGSKRRRRGLDVTSVSAHGTQCTSGIPLNAFERCGACDPQLECFNGSQLCQKSN